MPQQLSKQAPLSLSRATPFDLEAGCWTAGRGGGSGCKKPQSPLALAPQELSFFAQKGRPPSLSPLMICRGPRKTAGVGVPQGRTPTKALHLINGLFSSKKEIKCENNSFFFALRRNDRLPLSLCVRGVCSCPPLLSSALHSGFSTCTTVPVVLLTI
jgi:hypothetical protein